MNIEYEWMYVINEYYLYMNVNGYRLVDIAKCIYIAITHILSLRVGFCVSSLMRIVAKYCLLRIYCVYVSLKPS